MTAMQMPPIAILGAGPSGLVLGRLLGLNNIDYIIFERDESSCTSSAGGTLDIHTATGQEALKAAGLFEQFKKFARPDAQENIFADSQGNVLARFGGDEEGDGLGDRPEIDRKDLRAILLESVPAHKVRWGSKVERVQKDSDRSMSVHFKGGEMSSGFRLVVGADGAWSKARSLLTSAKPIYSGFYYLNTSIKPSNPFHANLKDLVGHGNYMAFGSGKQIIAQPLRDGTYTVNAGLRLQERWVAEECASSDAMRESLLEDHFKEWAPVVTDLIRYSDGEFRAWPTYDMPVDALSWKTTPGVTLVGDAAHVTKPSGEGANISMYDSLELAQQIAKHGLEDLGGAVAEYEESMFPRGIKLIKQADQLSEQLFAPDAPMGFLREVGILQG